MTNLFSSGGPVLVVLAAGGFSGLLVGLLS